MKNIIKAFLPFVALVMGLASCSGGGNKPSEDIKVESINFTLEKSEAYIGEQVKITNIKVLPENATDRAINWTLKDPSAGKINTDSKEPYVIGETPIKTKIIATAKDGGGATKAVDIEFKENEVLVSNITLFGDKGKIAKGRTFTPKTKIEPHNATNKNYKLVIDAGESYAQIAPDGISVNCTNEGQVTMHAEALDGSSVKSNAITFDVVASEVPIESVTLNMKSELKVNEEYTPTVTIVPEGAAVDHYELVVESQYAAYVKVSDDGHSIIGKGKGHVVMTARAYKPDGDFVLSNAVEFNVVTVPATDLEIGLGDGNTSMYIGDEEPLVAKITPDDASVQDVTYEVTEGEGVVSISDGEDGKIVTALKKGAAVIKGTLYQQYETTETLTDEIAIVVNDDLLIDAQYVEKSGETGYLPINNFEYIGYDEGDQLDSIVKITGDGNQNSNLMFKLHHAIDLSSGVLCFDVKSELTGTSSIFLELYDSTLDTHINMKFKFTATGTWQTINTGLYLKGRLNDLYGIRIFLGENENVSGSIYFDNFKFVKGSTYTSGGTYAYSNYQCVNISAQDFYINRTTYFEIKAIGTGNVIFAFKDSNGDKNLSGNLEFQFTNGALTPNDRILDLIALEDNWYGVVINLAGAEYSAEASLNTLYIDSTTVECVSFDLYSLKPYNSTIINKTQNLIFNKPIEINDLSAGKEIWGNALFFYIKFDTIDGLDESDTATFAFTLCDKKEDGSTDNITGDVMFTINPDNSLKEYKLPPGVEEPTLLIDPDSSRGEGWYLCRMRRCNFLNHTTQPEHGVDEYVQILEAKTFTNLSRVYIDLNMQVKDLRD